MIIIESRTKGIKFERHKEESLISSQFLKNQKKSKASPFLIFVNNCLSITMSACYSYVMTENILKKVLNNKTLNKNWFDLKLADPK